MKISEQKRAEAINMIKGAKACMLISLFVAGVLAIWAPFHLKFLTIAVIMGGLAGSITWLGWSREKHVFLFRFLSMGIPGIGLSISRSILLPTKLPDLGLHMLVLVQSISVLFAVYMATILLGVVWFKKEVADIFTPAQPPKPS